MKKRRSSSSSSQHNNKRRVLLNLPGKRTCPYVHLRSHLESHAQSSALERDIRDTTDVARSSQNKGMADFLKRKPNRVEDIMDIARRTQKPDEISKCLVAMATFPVHVVLDRGGLIYAMSKSTLKDIHVQRALCIFLNRICEERHMNDKYMLDETLRIALRALFLRDTRNGMPIASRSALALILTVYRVHKLTLNRVEELVTYILRILCLQDLLLNVSSICLALRIVSLSASRLCRRSRRLKRVFLDTSVSETLHARFSKHHDVGIRDGVKPVLMILSLQQSPSDDDDDDDEATTLNRPDTVDDIFGPLPLNKDEEEEEDDDDFFSSSLLLKDWMPTPSWRVLIGERRIRQQSRRENDTMKFQKQDPNLCSYCERSGLGEFVDSRKLKARRRPSFMGYFCSSCSCALHERVIREKYVLAAKRLQRFYHEQWLPWYRRRVVTRRREAEERMKMKMRQLNASICLQRVFRSYRIRKKLRIVARVVSHDYSLSLSLSLSCVCVYVCLTLHIYIFHGIF